MAAQSHPAAQGEQAERVCQHPAQRLYTGWADYPVAAAGGTVEVQARMWLGCCACGQILTDDYFGASTRAVA